jgi:hypothetical protein
MAIEQVGHVNIAQQQVNLQRRDGRASPLADS